MKYDFSKCNNLRWECGTEENRHNGFCRVFEDTGEYLIAFVETTNKPYGLPRDYNYALMNINNVNEEVSFINFRIIPRNPETYTDWQVGDEVKITNEEDFDYGKIVIVEARINNIVICRYKDTCGTYTCEELKARGNLVLTDYERTLIHVPKYVFNQGDKVLARDTDEDNVWYAGKYYGASEFYDVPYSVCIGWEKKPYNFPECIPYNEKTWRLLGTTDEYKENE